MRALVSLNMYRYVGSGLVLLLERSKSGRYGGIRLLYALCQSLRAHVDQQIRGEFILLWRDVDFRLASGEYRKVRALRWLESTGVVWRWLQTCFLCLSLNVGAKYVGRV